MCDHLVCDLWFTDHHLNLLADQVSSLVGFVVSDPDRELWKRVSDVVKFIESTRASNTTVVNMT